VPKRCDRSAIGHAGVFVGNDQFANPPKGCWKGEGVIVRSSITAIECCVR